MESKSSELNTKTLKIVISGAAGRIAYQLYSSLSTGHIFG